jgi:ADP-ribose pyrophosphatase YjhB (NUDIX family)
VKRYAFCPVCGSPFGADSAVAEPSLLLCRRCGFHFWLNSKPAVAALITRVHQGRPEVLLSRRGVEPHKGMWDLPGGFLRNGEAPHDGLARELREELGVRLVTARLSTVGIAEYARDDHAQDARFVLSLYYRCEIDLGSPLVATDDVTEVRWYSLRALPADMAFPADVRALRDLAAESGGTALGASG